MTVPPSMHDCKSRAWRQGTRQLPPVLFDLPLLNVLTGRLVFDPGGEDTCAGADYRDTEWRTTGGQGWRSCVASTASAMRPSTGRRRPYAGSSTESAMRVSLRGAGRSKAGELGRFCSRQSPNSLTVNADHLGGILSLTNEAHVTVDDVGALNFAQLSLTLFSISLSKSNRTVSLWT